MNRRSFMQSILAAGAAPAFVGSSVLMPVRQLWAPSPITWLEICGQRVSVVPGILNYIILANGMVRAVTEVPRDCLLSIVLEGDTATLSYE